MLSGDIEVNTDISRPGYLTDWKFDDVSSLIETDVATKGNDSSLYHSSGSTSIVVDAAVASQGNDTAPTRPMLNRNLSEGR